MKNIPMKNKPAADWAFSGSYKPEDVTFLLKPCDIKPTSIAEKEAMIQSGKRHYSEMLSAESVPDARYLDLYADSLAANAGRLRHDIEQLAAAIQARPETANDCVILSLARAGTPIGVLLKHALERLGVTTWHYSVSIIRGRGLDENALAYITARHNPDHCIFVDGWTGKGAIRGELDATLQNSPSGIKPYLAVVADPAGRADLAATFDDYVIPSGLLNGIVSGLVSRSVLNSDYVGPDDFHACLFMPEHGDHDVSQKFIDAINAAVPEGRANAPWLACEADNVRSAADQVILDLAEACSVGDINRIKPGIAEATRAVLRRVPDHVYVQDRQDPDVAHICHLAEIAGVPVIERSLRNYRVVTIIKDLGEDQQ